MKISNFIIGSIIFIAGILAGIWLGPRFFYRAPVIKSRIIVRDTVFRQIPGKTITLTKYKAKFIKTSDTIIQTTPFIAKCDTIIARDTVRMIYKFPDNFFSLDYRSAGDSIGLVSTKEIIRIETKSVWWERPAYTLAGFLSGFFISKLISR